MEFRSVLRTLGIIIIENPRLRNRLTVSYWHSWSKKLSIRPPHHGSSSSSSSARLLRKRLFILDSSSNQQSVATFRIRLLLLRLVGCRVERLPSHLGFNKRQLRRTATKFRLVCDIMKWTAARVPKPSSRYLVRRRRSLNYNFWLDRLREICSTSTSIWTSLQILFPDDDDGRPSKCRTLEIDISTFAFFNLNC